MAEINDLNVTDASNTARFPEAMAPSAVNDGARALEGLIARWHENINTSIASTGSGNAYVVAAQGTQVLFDGLVIGFDANHANTGASTLNVDSTGVKNILKHNDVALASGDIEANQKVIVVYDGTSWQMISQLGNAPSSELSGDTTPQLGGFLDPNSNYIGMVKGGDIASAAPLVVDTDGDFFDVTGTTGFAALTIAAHRHIFLQFDAALVMTHHATNLNLPGGANITTAAGDIAEFLSTGSNTATCVNYTRASGKSVSDSVIQVQTAYDATTFTTTSASFVASGHDDSITVGVGTRVLITATFGIGYNNAVYTGTIKCVETGGPTDIGGAYGFRSSDTGQGNESFTLQILHSSPGAGSKTYELYLDSDGTNSFQITKVQLVLQELE